MHDNPGITKEMVKKALDTGIIKIVPHPWRQTGTAFMIGDDYGWYFESDEVAELADTLNPKDFLKHTDHKAIVNDIYGDIMFKIEEDKEKYNYFLRLLKN